MSSKNKKSKKLHTRKNIHKYTTPVQFYNKYKHQKSPLFDLAINYYLLYHNYRNICQIEIELNDKGIIKLKQLLPTLQGINFSTFINKNNNWIRFIIYNKFFDISKLDITFGEKFAHQLGNFYKCATDKTFGDIRIVLSVKKNNLYSDVYAQKCHKLQIIQYLPFFMKKQQELKQILQKLDKNINVIIEIINT